MNRRESWKLHNDKPPCLVAALEEKWCIPAMTKPKLIKNVFFKDYFAQFPIDLEKFKGESIVDLFFEKSKSAKQNNDYEIQIKKSEKPKFKNLKDVINGQKPVNTKAYETSIAKYNAQYTINPASSPRSRMFKYYQPFPMENAVYLSLHFYDFKIKFVHGSPIVVRAYLFDGDEIVSEMLDWIPSQCEKEFSSRKNFKNTLDLAFEMPQPNPETSLVVTLAHPFHVDHGSSLYDYYRNINEDTEKSVKNQIINKWSRQNIVLETFAWTAAYVQDIVDHPDGFGFPLPIPISTQPDKKTIKTALTSPERHNTINLPIIVKARLLYKGNTVKNFRVARSFDTSDKLPSFKFRHHVIFPLDSLIISGNIESIICKISLVNRKSKTKINAFGGQFSKERTSSAITRLNVPKSKETGLVIFNEKFCFDLLSPNMKDLAIQLEIYNLSINNPEKFDLIDTIHYDIKNERVIVDSALDLSTNTKRNFFSQLRNAENVLIKDFEKGVKLLEDLITERNSKLVYSFAMQLGQPLDFKETISKLAQKIPENPHVIWYIISLALKGPHKKDSRIECLDLMSKLVDIKRLDHAARFANCMVALDFVSAGSEIVYKVYTKLIEVKGDANSFYYNVLTPRHVAECFICCNSSIMTFSLVCQSKDQRVLDKLLMCFANFSPELTKAVLTRMLPPLSFLFPIDKCPFAMFCLENIDEEMFNEWWPKVNHLDVIKSIYVDDPRFQLSAITFLKKAISPRNLPMITKLVYNMIPELVINNFQIITELINKILEYKEIFKKCDPDLAHFFSRIFMLACAYPDAYSLFGTLYETEKKFYQTVIRSKIVLTYSIHITHNKYFKDVTKLNNESTKALYQRILNYKHAENDLFELAKVVKHSPDATIEITNKIIDFYHQQEWAAEEIQTRFYLIAYLVEHMIYAGKIQDIFNTNHPFSNVCPSSSNISPIIKQYSGIYTDYFTNEYLKKKVSETIEACTNLKYYEWGMTFIDDIVPLCQFIFNSFYTKQKEQMMNKLISDEKRYFGNYFRIAFYGRLFGHENGLVFVAHFPKLSRLLEVCKYYTNYLNQKFGKDVEVVVIQSKDHITEEMKKDKEKLYLRVTYITPYKKGQSELDLSKFDNFHFVNSFYYESPFTESGAAQGSVEHQWLERNVLLTADKLPNTSMRSLVVKEITVKMPPIRVAYRQLHSRVISLDSAINHGTFENLQIMLSGNILTSVNEGVSRIAEVFLGDASIKDFDDQVYVKYRLKLKNAFEDFLEKNREGVERHKLYAAQHLKFQELQKQLEIKLDEMEVKLSPYLS